MSDATLATVIASRICHDLVSPVGAIVNGADLVRELGGADSREEMTMISQSAQRASVLLQFYRIAFGAAEAQDAAITRAVLSDQANAMISSPKIVVEWDGLSGDAIARAHARLLFQTLMCARAIVGMRGLLRIGLSPTSDLPFRIEITHMSEGAVGMLNDDLLGLLDMNTAAPEPTARQVEFSLVRSSVEDLGARLVAQRTQSGAVVTVG